MFKHFAVMDKKEMGGHSLQRVNFTEFTKFGYNKQIVPRVIPNDEMILIFRALVREGTSTMSQKE